MSPACRCRFHPDANRPRRTPLTRRENGESDEAFSPGPGGLGAVLQWLDMTRGFVEDCSNRSNRWKVMVGAAAFTAAIACGGRTATDDASLLDDSSMVGEGQILDVSNPAGTTPGVIGTNPPGVGATTNPPGGVVPTAPPVGVPTAPPLAPPPLPGTVPVMIPPPPTGVMPTPTGEPTTGEPTTNTSTNEPTTSTSEPTTTDPTTDPTTTLPTTGEPTSSTTTGEPTTSTPDPTTTVEPPPVFDPLNPPDGEVPLGLPPEYADFPWFDVDKCALQSAWAGTSECYGSYSCNQGWSNVDCYKRGANWSCSCYDFNQRSSGVTVPGAIVPANDTRQACRVASAICLSDAPPTEEPDCDDTASSSPSYCWRDRVCNSRWTSTYGDFLNVGQYTTASCSQEEAPGGAYCSCSDSAGYRYFELDAAMSQACTVGIEVCQHGVEPETRKPVECSWTYSEVFGSYLCRQYFDCRQEGLSNGVVVSTLREASVECQQNSNDSWTCGCSIGATFDVADGGSNAQAVCDAAAAECIQRVDSAFE